MFAGKVNLIHSDDATGLSGLVEQVVRDRDQNFPAGLFRMKQRGPGKTFTLESQAIKAVGWLGNGEITADGITQFQSDSEDQPPPCDGKRHGRCAKISGSGTMKHTGPWSDDITFVGKRQLPAFAAHLLRLNDAGRRQRFGCPTSDALLSSYVERIDLNEQHIFCVKVDQTIRGTVQVRPFARQCTGLPVRANVYQATLSVEEAWSRKGIGTALLIRALSVVRRSGGRFLMLDGLGSHPGLRRLVTLLGAELTFNDRGCQAWFHLAPDDQDLLELPMRCASF
jgi:GNAT superfamily N-acetyltransferase